MRIEIRQDFKDLIPPLTEAELDQLERSLLAQMRARDPLIVWKGNGVLLDGHNRYSICTKHNIPFDVVEMRCSSEQAAKNWIILNQLGRRNVAPDVASVLRGMLYNSRKKEATDGGKGTPKSTVGNSCLRSTAAQVAKETGVSERTVRNDGRFAEACEYLGINPNTLVSLGKKSRAAIIKEANDTKIERGEIEKPKPKPKPTTKPLHDRVCDALNRLINGFKESDRSEVKTILRQQLL